MQMETLDFNKKILHASWHPRENTIAVSVILYRADTSLTCRRSLQRTICSFIARHELPARGLSATRFPYPSQKTLAFRSTFDPRPKNTTIHFPRRQSNHSFPRPVTKHYDPRFPPRPLIRVARLAYDEFTVHVYHTLYSPRRVILFTRPHVFLASSCVFCGLIGKPSFWICPWFSALVVPSSSVLARVRFRPNPHPPYHHPPPHICVYRKKVTETDLAVVVCRRRKS